MPIDVGIVPRASSAIPGGVGIVPGASRLIPIGTGIIPFALRIDLGALGIVHAASGIESVALRRREEAMTVFLDDLALPFEESAHPERLVLIGESIVGRTLLVVFAEIARGAIIRIISARPANKRERRAYAEND